MSEEIHGCELCNKRAIVGLNDRWYCAEHINAGMKRLAKPVKKALWLMRNPAQPPSEGQQ